MDYLVITALALAALVVFGGCWLGWQLLRQNGRLLLRLEELEKRLDELEFGEESREPEGLTVGTEAPAFELSDLAGGRQSLARFREQPVLLVFFDPECGYCRELMPKLAARARFLVGPGEDGRSPGEGRPLPLIITTGDADNNRQFFAEHNLNTPVLLQEGNTVAETYKAFGTPSGYLISAAGKIASQLAMGAEALLKLADGKTEVSDQDADASQNGSGPNGAGRADRFGSRSLARSKIKRDGLKAGTPAPDFRLPRLDGRGDLTLSELRATRVLLVFSSPGCGPCDALAPELEKFFRSQDGMVQEARIIGDASQPLTLSLSPWGGETVAGRPGEGNSPAITVVMISKGEPKENRAKVKEHELTFPIVLQQQWEISRRYAMFATPIAYLIDEAGIITQDVAIGAEAILELAKAAPAASEGRLATA